MKKSTLWLERWRFDDAVRNNSNSARPGYAQRVHGLVWLLSQSSQTSKISNFVKFQLYARASVSARLVTDVHPARIDCQGQSCSP